MPKKQEKILKEKPIPNRLVNPQSEYVPPFIQVRVVGLNKADNGRKCDQHKGETGEVSCGQHVRSSLRVGFEHSPSIDASNPSNISIFPESVFAKMVMMTIPKISPCQ